MYMEISECICLKTHEKPKVIFYDMSTIQFFGHNLYNVNNNLNRAIRSSFFTAQLVKSKNEQYKK